MKEEITAALEDIGLGWLIVFADQGFEDIAGLTELILG